MCVCVCVCGTVCVCLFVVCDVRVWGASITAEKFDVAPTPPCDSVHPLADCEVPRAEMGKNVNTSEAHARCTLPEIAILESVYGNQQFIEA